MAKKKTVVEETPKVEENVIEATEVNVDVDALSKSIESVDTTLPSNEEAIKEIEEKIQEELKPFDKTRAIQFLKLFDLDEGFFNSNIEGKYELPIQPAKLQAAIMEYRAETLVNSYMKSGE